MEYIAAIQPDVMILDIPLCGGSGIEVSREVKRLQPTPAEELTVRLATWTGLERRTPSHSADV